MHVNHLIDKAKAREAAATALPNVQDDSTPTVRQLDESEVSESMTAGFLDHFRDVFHDLGSKIVGIVISYPLHVVVIRTVAQFVGREFISRYGTHVNVTVTLFSRRKFEIF